MPDPKERPATPGGSEPDPGVEALFTAVQTFLSDVVEGARTTAPEGESRCLVETTGGSLMDQFKKVQNLAQAQYQKLPAGQRREVSAFLGSQDGEAVARRGSDAAKRGFREGFGRKFLKWLAKWFAEIKKFLEELLKIVFDLLNIRWPDWLSKLLLILDEIFNALVELLADVFGIEVRAFARELSEQEVNYLNELTAFEHLRQAREKGRLGDEEPSRA